jgi:hypothetical protein
MPAFFQGLPLSPNQLQALFTDVEPPPDGKFIGVFLGEHGCFFPFSNLALT